MTTFELQRKNMVESQVRPSDITDRRIMRAMLALPREAFAAEETRALSYMDEDLPVGPLAAGVQRRFLMAPRVLARLVQALEVDAADRALEIGTATGYGAAVLAELAASVVALESDGGLALLAATALDQAGVARVKVVTGPLSSGWAAEAPYGAILIAGAIADVPAALLDQLRDGGRLAAVISSGGIGKLSVWRRFGSTYAVRTIGEASAPRLPGFDQAAGFVF